MTTSANSIAVLARRTSSLLLAALLAVGCATGPTADPKDPLEPINRKIFAFNDAVDSYFLKPVAQGYQTVTPQPARVQVSNFFGNLQDVWIGVNNLLQGKPGEAANDFGRFAVNSTVGILGFFDVATEFGLDKHDEDFGQTLAVWGVGDGPYLVLPLFGPRTTRDAGGLVVDSMASPVGELEDVAARNSVRGLNLVNTRANLLGAEQTLDQAALDKYVFTRNFYLRRRESLINDGRRKRLSEDDFALYAPVLRVDAEGHFAARRLLFVELAAYASVNPDTEQK